MTTIFMGVLSFGFHLKDWAGDRSVTRPRLSRMTTPSSPSGMHDTRLLAIDRPMAIVDHLVAELERGRLHSVAFVVPSDVEMTLPLYDVAIATAGRGWWIGLDDVRYWFVTPEPEPVSVAASERLEPEGIAFIGSTYPEVRRGRVLLDPQGESIEVDLVVSLGRSGGFDLTPDRRRSVPARPARRRRRHRAPALSGAHD
jgi:hypothetical protein